MSQEVTDRLAWVTGANDPDPAERQSETNLAVAPGAGKRISMLRGLLVVGAIASLVMAAPNQVKAESRLALVIGNSAYIHTAPLSNPRNDTELMADTLTQVGFSVTTILDADQTTMKRAFVDFGRLLRSSDAVGLFYYAGHGVQVRVVAGPE